MEPLFPPGKGLRPSGFNNRRPHDHERHRARLLEELDYINEAELSYPSVPKMGGTSWRGMAGPLHIFQWPYAARGTTDLTSSTGLEIQIKLENNTPFGGDIAIATFYGTSEDET